MHVIQVHVNDIPGGKSNFTHGSNTIVIPNSVFLNTKLNSIIQNETNDHEQLKNSILSNGKFISLDRENAPAKASGELESVFAISCSAADAEEILKLALKGVINDTTGEIGRINHFTGSDKNNLRVETMNLPYHVLGLVPIINNYENDDQGSMPMEFGKWWAKQCEKVVNAVVGFFITLWETIVSIVAKVVDAVVKVVAKIVEAVVAIIMWLIELLLKAILLILIWIIFAIMLVLVNVVLVITIGVLSALSLILDFNLKISTTSVEVSGQVNFVFGYDIDEEYNDFLDLKIPAISSQFGSNNYGFQLKYSFLNLNLDVIMFPYDLWNQIFKNNPEESLKSQTISSDNIQTLDSSYNTRTPNLNEASETNQIADDYIWELIIGICDRVAIAAGCYGVVSLIEQHKKADIIAFAAGASIFVAGIIVFLFLFSKEEDNIKKGLALIGQGLGVFLMGIVALIIAIKQYTSALTKLSDFLIFCLLMDTLYGGLGLELDVLELIYSTVSTSDYYTMVDRYFGIMGGIFGFILGTASVISLEEKTYLQGVCAIIAFVLASILLETGTFYLKLGLNML